MRAVEDRLFTLYQQAGLKISKDHAQESDALFEGLARSVLAAGRVPTGTR